MLRLALISAGFVCTLGVSAEPLKLAGIIPLPAVAGRIDHMAIDTANERLYVAALGNDTLEVIDLKQGRRAQSLDGFGEPQGIVYVPVTKRIVVASGNANRVDILDATTLATMKRIDGLEDADNVRYDARTGRIFVGYGSGSLRILNVRSGDTVGNIRLAGHPESFQLESDGARVFVNVPTAGHVAVVDRVTQKVVATWPIKGATANFPMVLVEPAHRLYVGTRKPPALLVYDTESGRLIEQLAIGRDTDDLFFDAFRKRIYAICGEGVISVVAQKDPDHHAVLATVASRVGARTGLFDAESRRLFVAVPASGRLPAEIRIYNVQ